MSGYAVSPNKLQWVPVAGPDDLLEGWTFSETEPVPPVGGFAVSPDGQSYVLADGPDGLQEGWTFSETEPVRQVVITSAQVDAERDRRIDAGVMFGGKLFQSRATDRENVSGAAQLGFMAVVGGATAGDLRWSDPDADFQWIASDNSLVPMDAFTVVEFGKIAAQRKSALIYAARTLKDTAPIPVDYADDKWWP